MTLLAPRAPDADGSRAFSARWLPHTPWLPAVAVMGWLLWAYLHLRPAAFIPLAPHPGAVYAPWSYRHVAYSDLISLYYRFHLANHALPYVHTPVEYPVLTGMFMWLAAWAPGVQGYFLVSSLGLLASALGTVYFLHRINWRLAWSFALCPLLLVYGLLNWDLLAIFFMVAGWAQFRSRRYAWAGVLLSLGVWAKFFPVIVLFYCVIWLLRDSRDRVHARQMVLWSGAVALVVNVPFALANVGNWGHFFAFNARRGGRGGILYELRLASTLPIPVVDLLSGALVVLAVALLVPRVLRGGSPIAAAAITFAVLLLVNKVNSPQYMLWLFVLGVIAEWPVWSLVLLSIAGLVNYADAMMTLYLSRTHSPAFWWFFQTLYPWNRALKNVAVAVSLVQALAPGQRSAPISDAEQGPSGLLPPHEIVAP